jgi:hypothetical protein
MQECERLLSLEIMQFIHHESRINSVALKWWIFHRSYITACVRLESFYLCVRVLVVLNRLLFATTLFDQTHRSVEIETNFHTLSTGVVNGRGISGWSIVICAKIIEKSQF